MKIWSVEVEWNNWENDTFTGTYEECVKYCQEEDYTIDGERVRLAEIEVDEDGCWTYCYDIVENLEEILFGGLDAYGVEVGIDEKGYLYIADDANVTRTDDTSKNREKFIEDAKKTIEEWKR